MQTLISNLTASTYKKVLKPLLFKQQPDAVHNHLLKAGGRIQHLPLALDALHKMWAYQNDSRLEQTMLGIRFRNPVGLSAGFDKNFELVPALKAVGFGFMEGGSLTLDACGGNPRPWFYRLPKTQSIVVYAGLANQGVHNIVARIQQYPASTFKDFPLNISVAKTNSEKAASESQAIADYVGSLKHIKKSNVGDMVTLNISCPNTYGGEPFTTLERLEHLLAEVDTVGLVQPLFIKMPANLAWPEFAGLLQVAASHKVAGVTISNLTKDRGQAKLMDSLPKSIKGGLSGKPTWDLSNNLIRATYQQYGKRFVIIGVGGIFSAEDAYTKIKLGATLVELITGLIFEGPQLIGQINSGLATLLEEDNFQTIDQAIGIDT